MKRLLLTLVLVLASSSPSHAANARCERPFIFFDLGDTLVDTKTYDFKKITYMPGAFQYLNELSRRGYPLGMIVNIPESWGKTRAEKMATLHKFIADLWIDPSPMAWNLFDAGVLIPMTNEQRKPAPILFRQALAIAAEHGCPAIFQGEEGPEVEAARNFGMKAFQVGSLPGSFFLPIEKIEEYSRRLRLR